MAMRPYSGTATEWVQVDKIWAFGIYPVAPPRIFSSCAK